MEIDCPEMCPYLKRHEAFQREKHAARYRKVWTEVNADIAQDRDTLQHVFFLERMLLAVSARVPGITDEQVATSLSDLRARLSPIELIAQPGTPLGRPLWEGISQLIEEGKIDRERIRAAVDRIARVLERMRDPSSPRAFLTGLAGFVPPSEWQNEPRLIITPSDLD